MESTTEPSMCSNSQCKNGPTNIKSKLHKYPFFPKMVQSTSHKFKMALDIFTWQKKAAIALSRKSKDNKKEQHKRNIQNNV